MRKIIIFILFSFTLPLLALAHADNPHDELIIRMTENGFEPKELTVTEGDEVLFINNDDVDRWPASNFHPTHTIYPEFDTEGHVKPGESWKFKFEKSGTWRMHDHLIPHMTGTIVVLENNNPAPTTETGNVVVPKPMGLWDKIKAFFARLFNFESKTTSAYNIKLLDEFKNLDEQAKYSWLEKRAELENPKIAWEYVLAAYNTPEGVIGNPHDMAHLVGQLLYKEYGFDGLSTCTPVFAFGCYHGLMEVAFDKDRPNDYQKNLSLAKEGCQTIGDESSPTYWSCIHGMGHGVITFREHNLNKALKDCDVLGDKIKTYCHDGVFMELSISAPANFYKKEDPIYPCNAIDSSYRTGCARSQTQVMRNRMGMNTQSIADKCIKSGDSDIRYHCIDSLGYFIGQMSLGKPDKIISDCKEIRDEASIAQCSEAAAGELVFQDMVGWQKSVVNICSSLKQQYQDHCNERVANIAKSYGRK